MSNNFDSSKFKSDLAARLGQMIHTEQAVNNGQLQSFFEYFLGKNEDKYNKDEWLAKLENEDLKIALRLIMIYSTMALTVHDDRVFAAAVEVFPMDKIAPEFVVVAKDTLQHIQDNPADDTRKLFIQGLGSQQFPMRMDFLRKSLNNALAGVF